VIAEGKTKSEGRDRLHQMRRPRIAKSAVEVRTARSAVGVKRERKTGARRTGTKMVTETGKGTEMESEAEAEAKADEGKETTEMTREVEADEETKTKGTTRNLMIEASREAGAGDVIKRRRTGRSARSLGLARESAMSEREAAVGDAAEAQGKAGVEVDSETGARTSMRVVRLLDPLQ